MHNEGSNAKEHIEMILGDYVSEGGNGVSGGEDMQDEGSAAKEHDEPGLPEYVVEYGDDLNGEDLHDVTGGVHDVTDGAHDVTDSVHDAGDVHIYPHEGMEFESFEDAFSFYKAYARRVGFVVTKRSSRRSMIDDAFIDLKFVCSRYGQRKENLKTKYPRPSSKTGCKASMFVKKRKDDGKWFTYIFVEEHNHELVKDAPHLIRSRKRANISTKCDPHNFLAVEVLNVGYRENNTRNELDIEPHLPLEEGDVQAMHEYFMHMQEENPNFFYALDMNGEQRLRNVFWVDAKGRHDYINFGDVVSFDATYVTNKYKIPLAPFIGVNQHGQLTVFGCSIIGEETLSTHVWLMKTWLRAMGGQAPKTIITNHEKVIKEAIKQVFPNSQHYFCLWHITREITEKLCHVIRRHKNFMEKFNKCIYRSWTVEDFERRWSKLVVRFDLVEDELLQSLYEDRGKWVPTYMRETFLAGLSTPQRTESVNSCFDKCISRKTTLKDFLGRFETALLGRCENESIADFQSWHTRPELKSPSPYELQMSSIYTREIFNKFQVEVMGTRACYATKERQDEAIALFRVNDLEKKQEFVVAWNEQELDISCLCCSFQFKGFLCRHAIIVLQFSGVSKIPSHYILKRWTKDAKHNLTSSQVSDISQSRLQRYNELCRHSIRLAQEGSLSQETFDIVLCALEDGLRKCVDASASQG